MSTEGHRSKSDDEHHNRSYKRFIARVKELKSLSAINAVLHWDQETQMPEKGAQVRAEQIALVSGLAHERLVSEEMGEWLGNLSRNGSLSELERVNVREIGRLYAREKNLPTELVQEMARTQSLAHEAWVNARAKSDYARFAPWLEKLLSLRKKAAKAISGKEDADSEALYDVLLDEFEPGARSAELRLLFGDLRKELVPLVAKIADSKRKPEPVKGRFPIDKQRSLGELVARAMGFDFSAGRLDVSAHPFCTSFNPGDVRITTRYSEDDFRSSLFGIMHEAGHGLYEQGFDLLHAATPLAEAVSMGIHESQSRLWENLVGRSKAFWAYFHPHLVSAFPEAFHGVPFDRFFLSINEVKPSLIRVEADEVTYNLHILVRFELEQALFSGAATVSSLPNLWNSKMEEYLGLRPKTDAEGVLQDIHWSMGAFGYFPTYALGNLYSAQFFAAADRDIPKLDSKLSQGDLLTLREWLRTHVHRHGMTYRPDELCRRATGEALSSRHFMAYLKTKFSDLYGV